MVGRHASATLAAALSPAHEPGSLRKRPVFLLLLFRRTHPLFWRRLGPGLLFDTDRYFVVCANILGSCYGSTGPTSTNPETGSPYSTDFPDVTMRDSVRLHLRMMREGLGVRQVACAIGGSLGGMQVLEWGLMGGPEYVRSLVPMSCGAYHHPWQIAISETQRQALYADPNWQAPVRP